MENNYVEHSCSCNECKNMCRKTPCIGTVEDMQKISDAGFSEYLSESYWAVGLMNRTHDHAVPMITPEITDKGCAFLDENGLCKLHDLGLKPTEGKLTNSHQITILKTWEEVFASPNYVCATSWDSINYTETRNKIFRDV